VDKKKRKWLILGSAGVLSGTATILLLRSLPIAVGTAAGVMVGIVLLKHVALALAVGSPMATLFQSMKPRIRAYCPWAPEDEA
jgi:hypothetical protein